MIEGNRKELECSRSRYETQLADFEQKYQMTSEEFPTRFEAGDLGDDADWFEWEFVARRLPRSYATTGTAQ